MLPSLHAPCGTCTRPHTRDDPPVLPYFKDIDDAEDQDARAGTYSIMLLRQLPKWREADQSGSQGYVLLTTKAQTAAAASKAAPVIIATLQTFDEHEYRGRVSCSCGV